jgi:hypothetical protein
MNPLSSFSIVQRGTLYVVIALLSQASTDLKSAFDPDPITRTKFWIQTILTGLITWRAYIDKSPAQGNPTP